MEIISVTAFCVKCKTTTKSTLFVEEIRARKLCSQCGSRFLYGVGTRDLKKTRKYGGA